MAGRKKKGQEPGGNGTLVVEHPPVSDVRAILDRLGQQDVLLARLDERSKAAADDIAEVKHVLLEGNGVPPLTTQVAALNSQVETLATHVPPLATQVTTLATQVAALQERKASSKKTMATIWAAVITGVFSFMEMVWRHIH